MFAWWGRTVYRYRYIVIGVMVALCLGGGVFGISLGQHVTQSGFYDDGSESVQASLAGRRGVRPRHVRPHRRHLHRPEGKTVDDPEWSSRRSSTTWRRSSKDHPDQILRLDRLLQEPRQC